VKEKPILFNAPMVRAILDGTKTQTRRIIKLPKNLKDGDLSLAFPDKAYGVTPCLHVPMPDSSIQRLRNPWGWPESEPIQLWVRETFTIESNRIEYIPEYLPPFNDGRPIKYLKDEYGDLTDYLWQQCHYKATDPTPELYYEDKEGPFCRWRSATSMPRWASRIQLEITNVRAERLQDISEKDALKEGVLIYLDTTSLFESARCAFHALWESINGLQSYLDNPWVWVIEFKAIKP
jgi:hypothetical protein